MTRALALSLLAACSAPSPDDPPPAQDAGSTDLVASQPDLSPEPPPDLSGPAPDPSLPGPFAVGVRTISITDPARKRTFSVDLWYPAAAGGKANQYSLEIFSIPVAQISSPAHRDAPPAPTGALPLVIFSHGFGGIRFQSYFITEHLASHGFLVASPDHPGNTLADAAQLGNEATALQSSIDRPLDVIFLLDHLLSPQSGVTIDAKRVGITGHSFGGWTALETARRDARLRAVFPMAPGFRMGSTPAFVAELARPLAIFGGSVDHTCSFAANQQAPYDVAQNPRFLVEIMGAGHLDFSNLCEVPLAAMFAKDGCDPQSIDPKIVQARTRTIATAFALRYLRDDLRYDSHLAPAQVTALGNLQYWSAP